MKTSGSPRFISLIDRDRKQQIIRDWQLYVLLLPTLAYYIIFHYWPMYGVQIAFKQFSAAKGITGSDWVGLEHFERFFQSYQFTTLLKNTLALSFYELIFTFPIPILFALLLNQLSSSKFRKIVQNVFYAPHFITTVVVASLLFVMLSPRSGVINHLIVLFGGDPIFFMNDEGWFRFLYVASSVWQTTGWSSIIYLGALANVNPELYEAADVDGANRFQKMLRIDLPSIIPTAVIVLILTSGNLMSVGFEKAYLMQTPLNLDKSEIISTYVYKVGLLQVQYSYSAAIGLFNTLINLTLLLSVNFISRKVTRTGLW